MSIEQIEQELLKLPSGDRARLAERLISSLDEDSEIDAAWIEEIERRDQEVRSGKVEEIPAEKVAESIRSQHGW